MSFAPSFSPLICVFPCFRLQYVASQYTYTANTHKELRMAKATLDKKQLKTEILHQLKLHYSKTLEEANPQEIYAATTYALMDTVLDKWMATRETYDKKKVKQAYYLSAEFLMGRAFGNNLVNLQVLPEVSEVLKELKVDINLIEDQEFDAGLGNGGLGRLAACFLDSMATLELPGHGYGIRYRYGIFEQRIINGYQVEYPDKWLRYGDPWAVKRDDLAVEVKFGGRIEVEVDKEGRKHFQRVGAEIIQAIPYDTPIIGYGVNTVNTLRLWEAESPEEFDLQIFNEGHYPQAVAKSNTAQDISRVLYPNDNTNPGKELRLRQQFFFVSASLQDIIRSYKNRHGSDFSKFSSEIALQLNDTHPVVAIPELMRILMDWEKMEWEEAWEIVNQSCAYTNHTLMAEALEKWPLDLFSRLLPRQYQIIEEINRRFMTEVHNRFPGDFERYRKMSIIHEGMINMAWLAIVGTHSVNGVAALHTELLRKQELTQWDDYYPTKFNNKTNGVTQRRWLLKCNPALSSLITETIGDKWITDLKDLKKLEASIKDKSFVKKFHDIKLANKKVLADFIKHEMGVDIDPNSIFDVQIKRLHEYKRQLLNVLHIMHLYNEIKKNPKLDMQPRTFIFGAKAASGYHRAKLIIKLINNISKVINNDASIKGKLKVVFLPNYRVSLAEKIFPASEVSEQISTAGLEASGTGNMKFMLNGAITIGTLDGANIEIVEEAGAKNAFIFGLKADEINKLNQTGTYNPWDLYHSDSRIKSVVDQLIDGTYTGNERPDIFRELYDALMHGVDGTRPDVYYVLQDFADYARAQSEVDKAYRDQEKWDGMAIMNVANSGKFSSDRTIMQYAKEIWNIKPVKI